MTVYRMDRVQIRVSISLINPNFLRCPQSKVVVQSILEARVQHQNQSSSVSKLQTITLSLQMRVLLSVVSLHALNPDIFQERVKMYPTSKLVSHKQGYKQQNCFPKLGLQKLEQEIQRLKLENKKHQCRRRFLNKTKLTISELMKRMMKRGSQEVALHPCINQCCDSKRNKK